MAYSRDYNARINWENFPSTNTAVDADNLNKMDYAIFEHDKKIVELDGRVETVKDSVTEDVQTAKEYSDLSKDYALESKNFSEQSAEHATTAYNEAERAKFYADTVQEGITTTNERELIESQNGGIRIISMDGESVQNGTPTPEVEVPIDSAEVSEIWTHGKNLWNLGNVSGTRYVNKTISLEPNTYTISAVVTSTDTDSNESDMIFNYEDGSTLALHFSRNSRASRKATFTKRVVSVNVYASNNYANSANDTFTFSDIQIEKGDVATEYEPYTATKETLSAPIVLRSIGDAKDVLCKQNGVFGVLRKVMRKTLNGSESYSKHSNGAFLLTISGAKGSWGKKQDLSNKLICNDVVAYHNTAPNYFAISGTTCYITSDIANVSDFKTWLASNNVTIDSMLATPTFEPLPLADQIALHKLETFGGVTYLFTDSTIEPIIEVEYGTSKVGGYAIKGLNNGEISLLELEQLKTLTNELAAQIVAGSEA